MYLSDTDSIQETIKVAFSSSNNNHLYVTERFKHLENVQQTIHSMSHSGYYITTSTLFYPQLKPGLFQKSKAVIFYQ